MTDSTLNVSAQKYIYFKHIRPRVKTRTTQNCHPILLNHYVIIQKEQFQNQFVLLVVVVILKRLLNDKQLCGAIHLIDLIKLAMETDLFNN